MPTHKFTVYRLQSTVKLLFLVTGFWLLVLTLSGCKAIGGSKFAALQVTSTPEASVFLDGKHLGKTPFFSDQLRAGEYTIKITATEATYIDKIILREGTLTVLNRDLANNFLAQSGETLWLEPGKKGLFVVSKPSEADLTVDGVLVGKTPVEISDIDEGEHKVALSKLGFADREFAVKSSQKYQVVADVALASTQAKGLQASPSPAPLPLEMVEIARTPQGFLRVRSEPSLTAPEIGRVKTGDKLELIQETEGWIKISFEGKLGWISAQYTKKLP